MKAWQFYAGILGVSAILVGCTHDFDAFETTNDEGGTSVGDGGESEAGDACVPATVCTGNAKNCATQCEQTQTTCEGQCGGGGGGGGGGGRTACRDACDEAGAGCVTECVSTCVICSTCPGEIACAAATK